MQCKVAPSILSANFNRLGADIARCRESGADYLHFDVMDGAFVPNISFGLPVLESVRKETDMLLDVHLMVDRPVRYVERFCRAGADIVTVHVEADTEENTKKALEIIRSCGKRAAVSVKPATPPEAVLPFLELCSMVLVMTVEPGFGGQSFMADMMPKVTAVRRYITEGGLDCEVEVDGGVTVDTAKTCADAGANVLVAGSAYFKAADPAVFIDTLHSLAVRV